MTVESDDPAEGVGVGVGAANALVDSAAEVSAVVSAAVTPTVAISRRRHRAPRTGKTSLELSN
jgi:hypothetical protein